ncbi:MAG TPA: prepilin-type N-terminal cleavage/methylation domain-containing protein [Opitutaceae bacterium]
MKRDENRKRSGFTLIELLLAASITAVLSGILVITVVQILGIWSRSGGAVAATGEATRILDQLAQDLDAAVLRPDANSWLVGTVQRDQSGVGDTGMTDADWTGLTKPAGVASLRLGAGDLRIDQLRFGQAGLWLRFFTIEPDANDSATNRSLPRAVAYQIVRRRSGARHAYQLFRSQVRPGGTNSTFSSGYDLLASAYVTPNGSEQHPGNIRRPNARFLLGNHVIDFGARIFVQGAGGATTLAFPFSAEAGQSFVATAGTSSIPGYASRPVVRGWPVTVQVMVRILTEEGARLISNLETGRVAVPAGQSYDSYWWELAEAHSLVQVRTITPRARVP